MLTGLHTRLVVRRAPPRASLSILTITLEGTQTSPVRWAAQRKYA